VSRLPPWLRVRAPSTDALERLQPYLKGAHTVCESAQCPNRGDCFGHGTATFMLLGDICTRNCGFCAVKGGSPQPPDLDEPERIARAIAGLGLNYAVLTSVTRDDLPDGGAGAFAATLQAVHAARPEALVETLVPDFQGDDLALQTVLAARPAVLNHNLETVPRLYPLVRPQAVYDRSVRLLARVKELYPAMPTKSGLMLGLGETEAEVLDVMRDLRAAACDLLTLGQYLRPSAAHLPVVEYLPPPVFEAYRRQGEEMGFAFVASGPLVRSSYAAAEGYQHLKW
jgi:lipoyl synthase